MNGSLPASPHMFWQRILIFWWPWSKKVTCNFSLTRLPWQTGLSWFPSFGSIRSRSSSPLYVWWMGPCDDLDLGRLRKNISTSRLKLILLHRLSKNYSFSPALSWLAFSSTSHENSNIIDAHNLLYTDLWRSSKPSRTFIEKHRKFPWLEKISEAELARCCTASALLRFQIIARQFEEESARSMDHMGTSKVLESAETYLNRKPSPTHYFFGEKPLILGLRFTGSLLLKWASRA